MKYSFSLLAIAACIASTNAHIQLLSPLPFRSNTSPPQNAPSQDFDMMAPLLDTGANFPCKLYHKDTQGTQSLVDWPAGSTQTMTFKGSASHGGGSCQASISEDGGASFKVIKSFIGGCPLKPASFVVPTQAKSGPCIFAWTWFNNLGNREMYMNCAAVTITGGGSGLSGPEFPEIFKANIGNGCSTANGDVAFPNPGPNVEGSGGNPPVGNCGSGSGGGSPPPPPVVSSTSPVAAPTPAPTTTSTPTPPPAATTTPTYPNPGNENPAPIAPTPVPAPNNTNPGPACVEGTVVCNSDGTWSQCGSGYMQNMGKTAEGTVCTDGKIHAINRRRAFRFSREHIGRRHSYGPA